MNKKLNLLLLTLLALSGCSFFQKKECGVPFAFAEPPSSVVSGTDLDFYNQEKVQYSPRLKAYPIGRYVDPNNPSIMHEGHVIYREEAPASWNRNPNAPTAVPLGPTIAISHPDRFQEHPSVEYETKIVRQNQLMSSLIDQNEALLEALSQLQNEVNQLKVKDAKKL